MFKLDMSMNNKLKLKGGEESAEDLQGPREKLLLYMCCQPLLLTEGALERELGI